MHVKISSVQWHPARDGFNHWYARLSMEVSFDFEALAIINCAFNTMSPRQNGRYFSYGIFTCILLKENAWISIKMSVKFVPEGPINTIPTLDYILAWPQSGDKTLSKWWHSSTDSSIRHPNWISSVNICIVTYGIQLHHTLLKGSVWLQ